MDYEEIDEGNAVQSIGRIVEIPMPFGTIAVQGGPYRAKPRGWPGIKLAKEIRSAYAVSLPVADYSVPDSDMPVEKALLATITLAAAGSPIYVGCMGGIGRTGLFLALLRKVSARSTRKFWSWQSHEDPVAWVRKNYHAHACETEEQVKYVHEFDTTWLERIVKMM